MGNTTNISLFGYTFTQSVMLIMNYGYMLNMPNWVVWFPTIVLGIGVGIVLIILLIAVLIGVFS